MCQVGRGAWGPVQYCKRYALTALDKETLGVVQVALGPEVSTKGGLEGESMYA